MRRMRIGAEVGDALDGKKRQLTVALFKESARIFDVPVASDMLYCWRDCLSS